MKRESRVLQQLVNALVSAKNCTVLWLINKISHTLLSSIIRAVISTIACTGMTSNSTSDSKR